MATIISKINAFQSDFQAFMQRKAKEIGISEETLNMIVQEEITKVKPVTQIETILFAASKAHMAAQQPPPAKRGEAVAASSAAEPLNLPLQPKAKLSAASASFPHKAGVAVGGAGASPTLTITSYKEAVQLTESWGDIAITTSKVEAPKVEAPKATATLPWMVAAKKEFTSFTKVTSKKGPNTYYFHRRTIPEILTSLTDSRTKQHPEDTLMEWLHNLSQEKVGPWLEDVTTRAYYRDKTNPFTVATVIYAFIPFFIKHNLTKSKLKHLGYCTAFIAIPEVSKSEISCTKYFGLSPGDEPTEEMLREVALIQAIQNYIMSEIGTLLESAKDKNMFKIRSVETDLSGDIKVSFVSEDAVEKFSAAMKYDMRSDGLL